MTDFRPFSLFFPAFIFFKQFFFLKTKFQWTTYTRILNFCNSLLYLSEQIKLQNLWNNLIYTQQLTSSSFCKFSSSLLSRKIHIWVRRRSKLDLNARSLYSARFESKYCMSRDRDLNINFKKFGQFKNTSSIQIINLANKFHRQ